MKSKMVMVMVCGLIGLLAIICVGEFYISIVEMKPVSPHIVGLLEHSIVGFIGVISGYLAGKDDPA
jgi:hypothetical protein